MDMVVTTGAGECLAFQGQDIEVILQTTPGCDRIEALHQLRVLGGDASRIAALVNAMNTQSTAWSEVADNVMLIDVELVVRASTGER